MKWLATMLKLGVVGALTLTLFGFAARLHPWLELCCHFRAQYVVIFVSLLAGLVALRRWPWVVAATLGLTLNLAVVVPCYFDADDSKGVEPALRVMLANLQSSNGKTQPLLDLVARQRPDVVGLLEVTPEWQRRLAPLRKRYAHFLEHPQRNNFGVALYSKLELGSQRVLQFGTGDEPSIAVRLLRPNKRSIYLMLTHPVPPMNRELSGFRDKHIEALADHLRAMRYLPIIAVGDLNATQFSPIFERLLRRGHLRSVRQGHGVLPTWPAGLWPMRIPLDHMLYSDKLRVLRVAVGSDIGSDHLPIIATFGFAARRTAR